MPQEEKQRYRPEQKKKLPHSIDSISLEQDELGIENIRLIDYGGKDDEIFKDLSMDDAESIDDLDITKIYENELEQSNDELEIGEEDLRKIRGFEESVNGKGKANTHMFGSFYPNADTGYRVPDLNSDVDNDICKENIRKIYSYLGEDQKKEEEMQVEIEKTLEYIRSIKGSEPKDGL
ncbi:uncharacterized protein NEMAJ01_1088 [Nematocida major]|uniref:uncharacterized protein n=1 Tax=Nematocida major TaxID=1912982 RepID=UPI0020080A49|nr:uncharacterized protein NEMAJ01_1088 [Nematocida major]KAH9386192.1 hypothetical protein NEMAJ01_1088 [Nematocida major]